MNPLQTPILAARGVVKTYRPGLHEVRALRGVDLDVHHRELVMVMGPSGHGKTTLLNCLSGLDDIDAGTVTVDGDDLFAMSDADRTRHRAQRMGFIFQAFNLIPVLSAAENVELPLLVTGVAPKLARERARDMLARVGLADRGDHRPGELSGGEQQRVTVARALVAEPALVWADEPTGALDSRTAGEIVELLHEVHAAGQTLVIVTHDEGLGRSGQRTVDVRDGRVVHDGAPVPRDLDDRDRGRVMTASVILGALASVLLLPLIVTALRQRTLVTMAVRNISRRRGEAALVVGGALLGTAIITASFVVGDVVEASFADVARTQYGPIDVVVTPAAGTGVHEVASALAAAEIDSVDGLLTTTVSTGTLEAVGGALPQIRILELDAAAARDFGADPSITGLSDLRGIAPGEVVVNERTAERLDVRPGDTVRLHAYADQVDLVVGAVAAEVGVAGYGGAIVPPGTLADLTGGAAGLAAPPRDQLLVSLEGGVFDTRERSDEAVTDIQTAVAGLPGVEVDAEKAGVLDDAERDGAALTQVFSSIGAFSVLAGVLLLINLFVMLAEERKSELGMLRAVGFTRRRLTRAFAIEGAAYAVVAAIAGAVVGVGVGWVVALVAGPIFGVAEGSSYPLVIEPTTLVVGATTGLVISMLTIWGTSLRIARLNIIRAIRDLPEPRATRTRRRTLVLGAVGIVAGSGVGFAGFAGDQAVLLLLGVPVAAFSAAPLLRRVLPDRTARLLVATTVLAWGLAVYALAPDTMADADVNAFVVQGVVLTAGAVSLASSIDRLWAFLIERFGRGGRGLAPRLGLAYPLARRFRTSMLLGMFSLVVFTVTILTSFTASMEANIGATVEKVAAGYDVVLDTNPASPVAVDTLTELEHVEAVAGLVQGTASFGADHLDDPRSWAITGFDAALLERGAPGLLLRDEAYATDADAYRAVLDDPTLAIVPEDFLVAGLGEAVLDVGDTFPVLEPGGGPPRELTVAGFGEMDWLQNGALVGREVATSLLGPEAVVARTYLAVADDVAADGVATSLNATFLANGADARTFTELGTAGVGVMLGFTELMRGFLGLGLLVGIAGLGVVMVRAVRERRQEIGMLRAMGFRTGLVRAALLSEAGLIAGQGTVIGAVLGLITSRQLLTGSDSFAEGMPFTVPWVGMLVILALPLAASLAATAWPASRAAAISPAVALRTAA